MDPSKVKAIMDWPTPTNVKEVQSFLGLGNYYRRFIENYAMIARPLHNLTRKNVAFNWNEECENAFQLLKKRFTEEPTLVNANPDLPFVVVKLGVWIKDY